MYFNKKFCNSALQKHELGEQLYFFYVFLFFEHIYHDEMRGNYIMENEKKRSYQREETRRKGCEIHIKKYIDDYSTMWPKSF